jgi:hypothetical protein
VERRVFLLLSGGDVRSGRSLSVVCLGPRPAPRGQQVAGVQAGGGRRRRTRRAPDVGNGLRGLHAQLGGAIPCSCRTRTTP